VAQEKTIDFMVMQQIRHKI